MLESEDTKERVEWMSFVPISEIHFFQFLRFVPNNLSLAVHELDEKHIGTFSLRTQEGLFQVGFSTIYIIIN